MMEIEKRYHLLYFLFPDMLTSVPALCPNMITRVELEVVALILELCHGVKMHKPQLAGAVRTKKGEQEQEVLALCFLSFESK